ncbi:acyl carrier protein [Flavobacterium sp. FlaQc-50]|uniref:acyl carrier protein n=1 Tax=unclassified Flavobacterium TaxID=196869 RepID=UPI003757D02B
MGNSKQTIEERVKFLISDKLGVDLEEVTNDSLLGDHLGADSLDTVEVIMEIEKEFNIVISDDIAENLETVQQHIKIVEKLYTEEIEVDLENENTVEGV